MLGTVLSLFFGKPDQRADGRCPLVDSVILMNNKFMKESGVGNVIYGYIEGDRYISKGDEEIGKQFTPRRNEFKDLQPTEVSTLNALLNFNYNYTLNYYKQSLSVAYKQLYFTKKMYETNLGIYTMMYSKFGREIELMKQQAEINEYQIEAVVGPYNKKTIWAPALDIFPKAFGLDKRFGIFKNFNSKKVFEKAKELNPFGVVGNTEIMMAALFGRSMPMMFQYGQHGEHRDGLRHGIDHYQSDLSGLVNYALIGNKDIETRYAKLLRKKFKGKKPEELTHIERSEALREAVLANLKKNGNWLFNRKTIYGKDPITGKENITEDQVNSIVNRVLSSNAMAGMSRDANFNGILQTLREELNEQIYRNRGEENIYARDLNYQRELSKLSKEESLFLEDLSTNDRRYYLELSKNDRRKIMALDEEGRAAFFNKDQLSRNVQLLHTADVRDAEKYIEATTINTRVINAQILNVGRYGGRGGRYDPNDPNYDNDLDNDIISPFITVNDRRGDSGYIYHRGNDNLLRDRNENIVSRFVDPNTMGGLSQETRDFIDRHADTIYRDRDNNSGFSVERFRHGGETYRNIDGRIEQLVPDRDDRGNPVRDDNGNIRYVWTTVDNPNQGLQNASNKARKRRRGGRTEYRLVNGVIQRRRNSKAEWEDDLDLTDIDSSLFNTARDVAQRNNRMHEITLDRLILMWQQEHGDEPVETRKSFEDFVRDLEKAKVVAEGTLNNLGSISDALERAGRSNSDSDSENRDTIRDADPNRFSLGKFLKKGLMYTVGITAITFLPKLFELFNNNVLPVLSNISEGIKWLGERVMEPAMDMISYGVNAIKSIADFIGVDPSLLAMGGMGLAGFLGGAAALRLGIAGAGVRFAGRAGFGIANAAWRTAGFLGRFFPYGRLGLLAGAAFAYGAHKQNKESNPYNYKDMRDKYLNRNNQFGVKLTREDLEKMGYKDKVNPEEEDFFGGKSVGEWALANKGIVTTYTGYKLAKKAWNIGTEVLARNDQLRRTERAALNALRGTEADRIAQEVIRNQIPNRTTGQSAVDGIKSAFERLRYICRNGAIRARLGRLVVDRILKFIALRCVPLLGATLLVMDVINFVEGIQRGRGFMYALLYTILGEEGADLVFGKVDMNELDKEFQGDPDSGEIGAGSLEYETHWYTANEFKTKDGHSIRSTDDYMDEFDSDLTAEQKQFASSYNKKSRERLTHLQNYAPTITNSDSLANIKDQSIVDSYDKITDKTKAMKDLAKEYITLYVTKSNNGKQSTLNKLVTMICLYFKFKKSDVDNFFKTKAQKEKEFLDGFKDLKNDASDRDKMYNELRTALGSGHNKYDYSESSVAPDAKVGQTVSKEVAELTDKEKSQREQAKAANIAAMRGGTINAPSAPTSSPINPITDASNNFSSAVTEFGSELGNQMTGLGTGVDANTKATIKQTCTMEDLRSAVCDLTTVFKGGIKFNGVPGTIPGFTATPANPTNNGSNSTVVEFNVDNKPVSTTYHTFTYGRGFKD